MTVDLRPLSADDFERRRPRLIAVFADELVESSGITPEQAEAESARQLDVMLPGGVDTPGQILRKAVDGDGTEVGFIWIVAAGLSHPGMAWVGVIEVQPEARSRGVGSRMMLAAEDDLRRRGTARLGLHVFGHNTGAQRLYTRLGYGILNQIWQRPATPGTGPAAGSDPRPARAEMAAGPDPQAARAKADAGSDPQAARAEAGAGPDRQAAPAEGVELRPVPADVAAELIDGLVATDPHGVARDPEAGIEQARGYVRQIAPDGLDAPGVCVRAAYSGGRRIGWIWFGLPKPQHPAVGVVSHIEVLPEERRRGHGRAMVAAAAAELARRDVPYIGLDVPGTRHAALACAAIGGVGLALISPPRGS
ncbi:GNAT family N-acetyltransferase [Actinoplanes sp. NPDC051411]|uniref:GNAT family N-acetyltransferase n=1 Tax=Actinoplanes sp. NPDC051411 TaxID=3155522 RepID=UPI003420B63B